VANAKPICKPTPEPRGPFNHQPPSFWDAPGAPEVDPGMAIAGFSLLAGTLTVLRARAKRAE
jgi:hypothetical protein